MSARVMNDFGKVSVVVGGQYGSEAKGAVAAYLARHSNNPVSAVRVAGPNAGHTVYGRCPRPGCPEHIEDLQIPGGMGGPHPWRLRQVPVAAVYPRVAGQTIQLYIAAGSEVDLSVLDAEVAALDSAGYQVSQRLRVDDTATLLTPEHIKEEQEAGISGRLGSTAKGIGAARVARIRREAMTFGQVAHEGYVDVSHCLTRDLRAGHHVIIEGTQGYGLGLHTSNYPYTTSSDCRAIDFLAMAGVSPWATHVRSIDVWVVLRTRPIRVAGNSGPLKHETSWDELGLPTEYTTVTKKERRVGAWDSGLARDAIEANGGNVNVALTMVDQELPWVAGKSNWTDLDPIRQRELSDTIRWYEGEIGCGIQLIGTGPQSMMKVGGR